MSDESSFELSWRGAFTSEEVNHLHGEAFDHDVYGTDAWDWRAQVERHSLGWVTARLDGELVGFANVISDGLVHAWIQDVMVSTRRRRRGVGSRVVAAAVDGARTAGCEWLHVDFDAELAPFYLDTCGFTPTPGGLMAL